MSEQPQNYIAEIFAFISIFISIAAFIYSRTIEGNVRKQSDLRFSFDKNIDEPLTKKLSILEGILKDISVAASEEKQKKRENLLSKIQTKEHKTWFFEINGFISSSNHKSKILEEKTSIYWDTISDFINDLNKDLDSKKRNEIAKKIAECGQEYICVMRDEIQKLRSNL